MMNQLLNSEIVICISKFFSLSVVVHLIQFALLAAQARHKLAAHVSYKNNQQKLTAQVRSTS
jgi:hypothetical protein